MNQDKTIAGNAGRLRAEIAETCLRHGRAPDAVRLMAVSKFQSAEAARAARDAGLGLFGESRVQEAERKFAARETDFPACELHMIGALQRNKARAACALFDCVQSVDRPELIAELGKHAAARPRPLDILFELNAGEESKGGYRGADALFAATEAALALPSLRVRGLMTMAPFVGDERAIRAAFRALKTARDALAARYGEALFGELSMGMSGDFKIAIEEGATLVRIGTALFGERAA